MQFPEIASWATNTNMCSRLQIRKRKNRHLYHPCLSILPCIRRANTNGEIGHKESLNYLRSITCPIFSSPRSVARVIWESGNNLKVGDYCGQLKKDVIDLYRRLLNYLTTWNTGTENVIIFTIFWGKLCQTGVSKNEEYLHNFASRSESSTLIIAFFATTKFDTKLKLSRTIPTWKKCEFWKAKRKYFNK